MTRDISDRKRFRILERDGFRCRYCGAASSESALVLDHVIPRNRGGGNADGNLAASCRSCNSGKSDSMPPDALVEAVISDQAAYESEQGRSVTQCRWCGRSSTFALPIDVTVCGICYAAFMSGALFIQEGGEL